MNCRTISDGKLCSSCGVPRATTLPPDSKIHRVGHRRDLRHVVRHHDAGEAERVVQAANQAQDDAHRDRVEADEGLVVDQDLRVHDDRARQRDAPRHAAGELRGHQLRGAAQTDRLQLGEHQLADQPLRQIRVLAQREGDVLEHVQIGEQRAVLEQHAHAPAQHVQGVRLTVRISWPATCIEPPSADSWPVISRSSVVLPVPLGPMTAVTRPRAMSISRPENIGRPLTA